MSDKDYTLKRVQIGPNRETFAKSMQLDGELV